MDSMIVAGEQKGPTVTAAKTAVGHRPLLRHHDDGPGGPEAKAVTAPLIPAVKNLDEPALACPVCGFDYVHPVAVECRSPGQANGRLRIDHQGIHLDPTVPPDGRGVVIALTFLCEDGHLFTYRMRFHKGMTFFEQTLANEPREADLRPQTIWRD
jgi:hypothetical protein